MCKIAIATGIDVDLSEKKNQVFLRVLTKQLIETEKDGFGYAALSQTSGLFGERWVKPENAWKSPTQISGPLQNLKDALDIVGNSGYSAFGNIEHRKFSDVKTIMLHSRTSTNRVSIENTHPFEDNGVALIHNGSISNAFTTHKDKLVKSTCDSEVILNLYNDVEVENSPDNINFVSDELRGWYAVGVLTDRGVLDIFRNDSGANLVAAHIPELGKNALVFCTKEELVIKACEIAKFEKPTFFKVLPGMLIRIKALTGEVESITEFEYKESWVSGYQGYYGHHEYSHNFDGEYGSLQSEADIETAEEEIEETKDVASKIEEDLQKKNLLNSWSNIDGYKSRR